jgi:uncharacterized membrane protein
MIGDDFAFSEMVEGNLQSPVLLSSMEALDLEDVREHVLLVKRNAIQAVENIKQTNDIPMELSVEESREYLEGESLEKFDEAVRLFAYANQYLDPVIEAIKNAS